jgi:hypothetical protein
MTTTKINFHLFRINDALRDLLLVGNNRSDNFFFKSKRGHLLLNCVRIYLERVIVYV